MNNYLVFVVIVCMWFTTCYSSCVHGATSCSMNKYIEDLDNQISQLTCTQKNLMNVVSALSINTTLTGDIVSKRQKQLNLVSKALDSLILENNILKKTFASSSYPVGTVTLPDGGLIYSDGSRARSCNEYRNPPYPYQYTNQGNGLYVIEPVPGKNMTVYCDMTTDGGGWTLISGIKHDYQGIHFHTFEDSSATSSSESTPFHIETSALLDMSTQIRAATDSSSAPISSFYQSNWEFSCACNITSDLRNAIKNTPGANNGNLPATCFMLSGTITQTPTHFTYGRTCNSH